MAIEHHLNDEITYKWHFTLPRLTLHFQKRISPATEFKACFHTLMDGSAWELPLNLLLRLGDLWQRPGAAAPVGWAKVWMGKGHWSVQKSHQDHLWRPLTWLTGKRFHWFCPGHDLQHCHQLLSWLASVTSSFAVRIISDGFGDKPHRLLSSWRCGEGHRFPCLLLEWPSRYKSILTWCQNLRETRLWGSTYYIILPLPVGTSCNLSLKLILGSTTCSIFICLQGPKFLGACCFHMSPHPLGGKTNLEATTRPWPREGHGKHHWRSTRRWWMLGNLVGSKSRLGIEAWLFDEVGWMQWWGQKLSMGS